MPEALQEKGSMMNADRNQRKNMTMVGAINDSGFITTMT